MNTVASVPSDSGAIKRAEGGGTGVTMGQLLSGIGTVLHRDCKLTSEMRAIGAPICYCHAETSRHEPSRPRTGASDLLEGSPVLAYCVVRIVRCPKDGQRGD